MSFSTLNFANSVFSYIKGIHKVWMMLSHNSVTKSETIELTHPLAMLNIIAAKKKISY